MARLVVAAALLVSAAEATSFSAAYQHNTCEA